MQKYVFKKYSPEFKRFFKWEEVVIKKAVGNLVEIKHVGSTAVEGLGGKGIIDIMLGVRLSDLDKVKTRLEKAGYQYRKVASVPGRIFFRKDYISKTKTRRIHIHLTIRDSHEWNQIIMFKDYLKNHPNAVKDYTKIKKKAVKTAKGDGGVYRKLKEKFINKILEK